ncbi:MAG: metallophosphoesterase [Paludibacter sp.]
MSKIKFLNVLIFTFSIFSISAQQHEKRKDKSGDNREEAVFNTVVPTHPFDIILGRPTANSITLSILCYKPASGQVEYWNITDKKLKTKLINFESTKPTEILLSDLQSDKQYFYRLIFENCKTVSDIFRFHTQRQKNSNFSFTITADSHLDENAAVENYKTTLLNAAADSADFHFDLGDTFMTDKYREQYKNAFNQYIAQRYYFGLLCSSAPLFFVLGNHDGESGQRLNGTENNPTVWSNLTRKTYFPNPLPNNFYTGDSSELPFIGLPQDYYAFEWGNAQFIVLDPFLFTPRSGMDNPWDRTLGKTQYDWLKATLENSKATFKFVFIHNLVGGVDLKGRARGGAEVAGLYEWGGKNPDGTNGFPEHRPGWEMPIHDLLLKNHVSVVFHGHDHLFARQEKDGIIYQCISQTGSLRTKVSNQATEYGYQNNDILLNPGYMRVGIQKDKAVFEFVNTDNTDIFKNKKVIYQYELKK